MTLGEQIVGYRKNHGYSQEELSHVSGISLRTIQRIEKGKVIPRGHTLKMLANSLLIKLSDLKTSNISRENEVVTKSRILNTLGLLVIVLPLASVSIQLIYWMKNKDIFSGHTQSHKVLSFQILWIIAVFIFFSLAHILTYTITGQSVYGHFPVRTIGYSVLLIANISVVIHTAFKLSLNAPVSLSRVPSMI
ncbi:MAG: helix-turn-helix transcriptional regulator [Cyclobacteriaceae bacterium]